MKSSSTRLLRLLLLLPLLLAIDDAMMMMMMMMMMRYEMVVDRSQSLQSNERRVVTDAVSSSRRPRASVTSLDARMRLH